MSKFLGSVSHGRAVITAGSRNHAGFPDRRAQNAIERAARFEGAGMLKAFELEKNPGVNAESLCLQGHHRGPADMHSDPSACILNFSARNHSGSLFVLVFRAHSGEPEAWAGRRQ